MPHNNLPDMQVVPVRDLSAIRIFPGRAVAEFVPTATYQVGVARLDPSATANGAYFSFSADQQATIVLPSSSATSIGSCSANTDIDWDDTGSRIFGCNSAGPTLYEINEASGATVNSVGTSNTVAALVFEPTSNRLYCVDSATNNLIYYPVSVLAGAGPVAGTVVGALGVSGMESLTRDPLTGTVYGSTGSNLYVVDLATGVASLVGAFGGSFDVRGLAFDPTRRKLFGVGDNTVTQQLYEINPNTGGATVLASVSNTYQSAAVNPTADRMYAISSSTLYYHAFPDSDLEWDITYDATYEIDGNPNFIDQGGVPTFLIDGTVLPNEDEFYIIGLRRVSDGRTTAFSLVYKEKADIDIFDTTSQGVDLDMLDRALALSGHNLRMVLEDLATGQPSSYAINTFPKDQRNLSTAEADVTNTTNRVEAFDLSTTIDNSGNPIQSTMHPE